MLATTKIFNRLVEDYEANYCREAHIDFTVNGVDFSLTVVNSAITLWYDDEAQVDEIFSTDEEDVERLVMWLHDAIGDAIQ